MYNCRDIVARSRNIFIS